MAKTEMTMLLLRCLVFSLSYDIDYVARVAYHVHALNADTTGFILSTRCRLAGRSQAGLWVGHRLIVWMASGARSARFRSVRFAAIDGTGCDVPSEIEYLECAALASIPMASSSR
jgi:hypothetical protein